jgi:hypothetical protein
MITGAWAAGLAGANRDLVAIHERAAMIHDEAAERHAAAAKRWRHDEPELAELERRKRLGADLDASPLIEQVPRPGTSYGCLGVAHPSRMWPLSAWSLTESSSVPIESETPWSLNWSRVRLPVAFTLNL